MATSSFHSFSRLPAELRSMIWKEACVTKQPHQRAIHHVDILRSDGLLVEFIHPGFGNDPLESACLMNFGLWEACKESRRAMTQQHFNLDESHGWTKMKIRGTGGRPNSYCLVDPNEDIFCIRTNNWDEGNPKKYRHWYEGIVRYLEVKNVALEFDPAWLIDLPENEYDLRYESSPRRLLTHLIKGHPYAGQSPNVWLIDRETIWTSPKLPKPTCVYGNEEYVKVNFYDICAADTSDERSDALPRFLQDLRMSILKAPCVRLGMQPGDNISWSTYFWNILDNVPKIKVLLRGYEEKYHPTEKTAKLPATGAALADSYTDGSKRW